MSAVYRTFVIVNGKTYTDSWTGGLVNKSKSGGVLLFGRNSADVLDSGLYKANSWQSSTCRYLGDVCPLETLGKQFHDFSIQLAFRDSGRAVFWEMEEEYDGSTRSEVRVFRVHLIRLDLNDLGKNKA